MKNKEYSKLHFIRWEFLIACLIFSAACEKIIYFDVETYEGKLVVNSFISPLIGSTANVSISTDPLADDSYPEYISDATIELYKNGVFISNYVYNDTLLSYTVDETVLSAHAGDVFTLIASAPGYDTVSAETTIPQQIEITDIRIADTVLLQSEYVYYDSLGNPVYFDSIPYYKFEIEFTDPAGENYYSLEVQYEDDISSGIVCYSTNDPVYSVGDEFVFGSTSEDYLFTICDNSVFSDLTFENTKKTFTLYALVIDGIFFPDAKYVFTLRNIGTDYYKYYSSTILQQSNEGDPFAQPVSIFSNIQGGFGVFAAYSESIVTMDL